MNLTDAKGLIKLKHIEEAANLTKQNGVKWLLEQTGRKTPKHRYIVVYGERYPTKAFGFLVAQLALNVDRKENDLTTNEAAAPLVKLGFSEISAEENKLTSKQKSERAKSYYSRLARPEQAKFRLLLLEAFERKCAITQSAAVEALEAAHIQPFADDGLDEVENGILLRVDLHKLFDAGLIAINPETLLVSVHSSIAKDYEFIKDVTVSLPSLEPSSGGLQSRWKSFIGKS